MKIEIPEPIRARDGFIELLDQRQLPQEEIWVSIQSVEEAAQAIQQMIVRGAPAIGVTAAYAVALAARDHSGSLLCQKLQQLRAARPTAVNLNWAVDQMQPYLDQGLSLDALWQKAVEMHQEDREANRRVGASSLSVLKSSGLRILTHCNAGALACGGYGTALGVLYALAEEGRLSHVYVDETRPYLQGSRLTAWEMEKAGLSYNVICDNMAASLMQAGQIDAVVTGADRIAANGDTANKIGTYGLAVLCQYHAIPFYVAAPFSTIDPKLSSGADIPIEHRSPLEAGIFHGKAIAPDPNKYLHPGFDVTPASLIAAIFTDRGAFQGPYKWGNETSG